MATSKVKFRKRFTRMLKENGRADEARALFGKKPKTPTPVEERSFVTAPVIRRPGDAKPSEALDKYRDGGIGKRSRARRESFILSGGSKRGSSLSGAVAAQ